MNRTSRPDRTPSAPVEATPDAAEREIPPVVISGYLAERLTIVTQASAQLVTGIGATDTEEAVLVPCVDIQVFALPIGEEESQVVYSPTVSFENFVFVLSTLAADGARACRQLAQMSKGELKPDDARISHVTDMLGSAIAYMQESLSELEGMKAADVHSEVAEGRAR